MIKKLIIKRVLKRWQNYLGLKDFKIYIIKESRKLLDTSWKEDERSKRWGNYLVQADNYFSIEKKVILVRLNKDLSVAEMEKNIVHELVHVKIEEDEEWVVEKLTKYLLDNQSGR